MLDEATRGAVLAGEVCDAVPPTEVFAEADAEAAPLAVKHPERPHSAHMEYVFFYGIISIL